MESQAKAIEGQGYDVFISFVTDPDYKLAREIRDFLESFAERVRASGFLIKPIRVFVDTDNLSRRKSTTESAPDLESALRNELLQCRHLLVLCCRNTPRSRWVQQEFEWYSQARGTDAVLLAVTDPVDPALEPSAVFPDYILSLGLEKRLWYDLRSARLPRATAHAVRPIEDVLTQLAAHLSGRAVAEVTSAYYREQRRLARNRLLYLALAGGAMLAAVIGGYQAYISRLAAERSTADRFIQTGMKAQSEGDLAEAASAFRNSLQHADTPIARLQLAGLTTIPVQPLRVFDLPSKADHNHLTTVAFIADRTIMVGDKAGELAVLDIDNGVVSQVIKLRSGVNALAVFSDSTRVAAGLEDGSVFLVDSTSGEASQWKQYSAPVLGLRAHPASGSLAVGLANDAGVVVLNRSGDELMHMSVHTDDVQGLAFNKDGTYLYWGGSGPYIWACPVSKTSCDRITAVDQYVYSIDGSASSRYSAAAVGDQVILFDHALKKMDTLAEMRGAQAFTVTFDPSSEYLAAVASDGTTQVYDVQSRRVLLHSKSHRDQAYAVAFSPGGDRLVSVGLDGRIAVWRVEREGIVMPPHNFRPMDQMLTPAQRNQITDMRVLNDNIAVVTTADQQTRKFDLKTLSPSTAAIDRDSLRAQLARSFSFSRGIARFGEFGEAETWKEGHAAAATVLERIQTDDSKAAMSQDARFLALALKDGTIHLLDMDGTTSHTKGDSKSNPTSIVCLDGQPPAVAVGYADGTVTVFDGRSLKSQYSRAVHSGSVDLLLFSATAQLLFTSGQDGSVRALSLKDGRQVHAFVSPGIQAMAVSENGKFLAVAGLNGTVELLDVSTMQPVATLAGNRGGVSALGFDSAASRLYSAGGDEMLRSWNVTDIAIAAFGSVSEVTASSHGVPQPSQVILRKSYGRNDITE